MRGRKKGTEKTGGRDKGTPNRVTAVSQDAIAAALAGCSDKIQAALSRLERDPYLYIQAVTKLLPFVVPKKTDITSEGQKIQSDLTGLTFEQLFELKYGRKPERTP